MAREQFITRLDDDEYAMLEALAAKKFDCSMAAANRKLIEEMFYEFFGDLEADAILDGRITDGDVEELLNGDLSPEDFSEDVRAGNGDGSAMMTADGGAKPTPDSYEATYGPQEVARSGPTMSWDNLVDVIDLHWSDTLEVHPDRVPRSPSESELNAGNPNRLKQVNRVTPKIVAGMCRSVATNELVPGEKLTEFIDEYLSHLNRREDQEEGRKYLHANYRERVGEYLYEHPDPGKDVFYTSESKLAEVVDGVVREPFSGVCERHPEVFNFSSWSTAVAGTRTEATRGNWQADLGRWLERVAMLQTIRLDADYRELAAESSLDLSDTDYHDVVHYLTRLSLSLYQNYRRTVNAEDRDVVEASHVSDEAISVLEDLT